MSKKKKKVVEEPERRWFFSRRSARGPGWWTNYNEVAISVGDPPYKFHGESVPESAWTVNLRLWPPRLMVFKHLKLIIWLGDREWKRALKG